MMWTGGQHKLDSSWVRALRHRTSKVVDRHSQPFVGRRHRKKMMMMMMMHKKKSSKKLQFQACLMLHPSIPASTAKLYSYSTFSRWLFQTQTSYLWWLSSKKASFNSTAIRDLQHDTNGVWVICFWFWRQKSLDLALLLLPFLWHEQINNTLGLPSYHVLQLWSMLQLPNFFALSFLDV